MLGRSFHFVPANRPKLYARAARTGADWLVFDLEDAVPAADRGQARHLLATQWAKQAPRSSLIRVNGIDTPDFASDLELLEQLRPAGAVLPKSESASALRAFAARLRARAPGTQLVILIESFAGLRSLPELIAVEGVNAVGLGLEDMLSDHPWAVEATPLLVNEVRLRLVLEARARGLLCIDTISVEVKDQDRIDAECRLGKSCGMDAKFSIHPLQVPVINRCFSASATEISQAESILAACSVPEQAGYGRVAGQILSPPKVKKALRIIQFNQTIHHVR